MAKPTTLPDQVFQHVPDQALAHLPTELPPSPVTPTVAPSQVTLPQHALDAVEEHVPPLGVAHLPDFFGLG
jgi:hypothetical protein